MWSEVRAQLHFFTCGYPLVTDHLLKRLSFTEWPWHSYRKSTGHRCMGLLLESILFHWLIYISNLMLIAHYFNYSNFIVISGVMNYEFFKFVFLFQYGFGYLESVVFHMNLKLNLSISAMKTFGIVIGTALNLQITSGSTDTLTTLSLAIHEPGISSCNFFAIFSVYMFCFLG